MIRYVLTLSLAFVFVATSALAQTNTAPPLPKDDPQPTTQVAGADSRDDAGDDASGAVVLPPKDIGAPAVEMVEATLKDGTKISIEGENIFFVSDDGTKTPAPDGKHTLADGTTMETKGGKLLGE